MHQLYHAEGFALALFAMVLYGVYMVPRKKSSISAGAFTFWMGVGILLGTSIIGLVSGDVGRINPAEYLLIFVSGVVWATGTHAYSVAVKMIGLSRSTPLKNVSAVLATLAGIIIFGEFSFQNHLAIVMVIAGSVAITVSASILARVEAPELDAPVKTNPRYLLYGILCSLWAAVAYSVYTIPMKIAYSHGISPSGFLFYMGHGCFVGMTVMALFAGAKQGKGIVTWKDRWLAQLSGAMWAVGSVCANIAVGRIGVAVTWPLTKNTVIAVAYGVIILKEVDIIKHKKDLRYGILLSIVGVILLAVAMSQH